MVDTISRFLVNFILSGVLILIFRGIGWITFLKPPVLAANNDVNNFLVAAVIAFVIFVIGEIIGFIYQIIKKLTFIFGCFVAIIYFFISGYLKLGITALILTGWFTYSRDLISVLVISTLIGLVRLPQHDEMKEEMKQFRQWKKNQG